MKFIYGKQDFRTLELGQENCYLLTNGMGGFSSCTMVNSNTRNDHALLMACVKAPNHRYNMIHRLSEALTVGKESFWISSQEFVKRGKREDGYSYLSCFTFADYPEWRYLAGGVEISKKIAMKQGENTVEVRYAIHNRSGEECCFRVTPQMQFTRKGEDLEKEQQFLLSGKTISSAGMKVYFETDGDLVEKEPAYEEYFYAYDACDGRREHGRALSNHEIVKTIPGGATGTLDIQYSMSSIKREAGEIVHALVTYRSNLERQAGFTSPLAGMLAKSAGQFVAHRESTGGKTILAGYPFFEDWGRDTMIALPGCCITTGRYETAKSILRTFMECRNKGLMPNLFPEGGNQPAYNTVDAALLFINCVYLYYEHTGDALFVKEAYQAMEEVIIWYQAGTDYGIHMDEDGLIMAGNGLDQVTWMDVRVGEILPTPRHGKPVEINAYWYNALCIMEIFAKIAGQEGGVYGRLAEKVRASFLEQFWMEDRGCLKDVLSGTGADEQIRCNQIWAVSMPFTMLPREKELLVVETVFEKLYTPYGLRTLSMEDGEFKPFYGGGQMDRDMAYHQGTVWTFPLGGYYLAYLKVHDHSWQACEKVRGQLEVMESALREGCIGQLPEIYDGKNPSSSKGCFAQAWSVGEILRVYEALEGGKV